MLTKMVTATLNGSWEVKAQVLTIPTMEPITRMTRPTHCLQSCTWLRRCFPPGSGMCGCGLK